MHVRFMNLSMPSKKERKPYLKLFNESLKSGMFIMGKEVEEFETKVSTYCESKYAIGVSSGTDALILALKAYNIGLNDEVIIPDMSFIATANAVSQVGAKAIFCDINDDFNINHKKIEELITKNTKAIIPVHYAGKIANMAKINAIASKYNLVVIEDASQAFGSKRYGKYAGSLGDIACFSLNPMKPLGALGEAGLVTTNSKKIAQKIKALRYNGLDEKKSCIYKSLNAKIDTIQAKFLSYRLDKLKDVIKKRKKNVKFYNKHLKNFVRTPIIERNTKDSFFTYTILVERKKRDDLYKYLINNSIEVKINHTSMHLEPAYKEENNINLENSIKISKMKLSLPCHEKLTKKELKFIVKTIKEFFNEM